MSRELRINDSVIVNVTLKDDNHPPSYIAYRGDKVYVKEICGSSLRVNHEGNANSFWLKDGQYRRV